MEFVSSDDCPIIHNLFRLLILGSATCCYIVGRKLRAAADISGTLTSSSRAYKYNCHVMWKLQMLYGELEDVANTLFAHGLLLVPAASRLEVIYICTCKSLWIVNSLARLGNELRPNAFFFHLKLGT